MASVEFLVVLAVVSLPICKGSQDQHTTTDVEDYTNDVFSAKQQLPEALGKISAMETNEDSYPIVEDDFQGRKLKVRRRLLVRALVFLKALWLGVLMPMALIFALASSWQAATLSLVALGAAAFLGLKTGPGSHPSHVVHPSSPGWWQDRDWNLEPEEYKRTRRQ